MGAFSHDVAPTTLAGLWRAAPRRLRVVVVACLVSAALALVAGGGALGRALHPKVVVRTETKVVTETKVETKVVEVEKPVIQWRDRVVTRVVYRSDGSVQSETKVDETSGKKTGEKVTTTEAATEVATSSEAKTSRTPAEAPRLHGFVELSLGTLATWPPSASIGVLGGLSYDLARIPFLGASWFVGGTVYVPLRLPGAPIGVSPTATTLSATTGLGW
jgi:hypothetical protein